MPEDVPPGFEDMMSFPLVEALLGRRARRFSLGAEIPDGPLVYKSRQEPLALSELEQALVLTAAGGNTGWHYMITRHARYAPHLSNYPGAAGGRTFPSAAGFHTSELFYTDDSGVYFFPARDAPALAERAHDGSMDLNSVMEANRRRVRKLSNRRLNIPPEEPYMEGHNTWCVNRPGSMFDDVNGEKIPGLERFGHLADVEEPFPLTYVEQYALTELTAELATACYAGMLMLQAMGLGGWMFDGIDRHSVLGAMGEGIGLGFRYDEDERWSIPNPTGLEGVFEGYCPPHYPDMRAAVEAFTERKFGPGGPFHADTPGPWKESGKVRGSAEVHSDEFKECVAIQAQYVYDRFGKFPGTVPSIFCLTYLQAHHLDLEFYDHHFKPGAYLRTHAEHMSRWH